MHDILQFIVHCYNFLSELPANLIDTIPFLPEWSKDAIADSLNLIPFLFVVFLLIEIVEQYFTRKKHLFVFYIKKVGPLFGSLFASIPQCGFSVIASTLYVRRILSRGTLLAVYLATSDEAIPVLLTYPSKIYLILPIILIKVIIAVIVGYLVDLLVTYKAKEPTVEKNELPADVEVEQETGCCHHHIVDASKTKEFWYHPLKHTFNIFLFILVVSLVLAFLISKVGTEENLAKYCLMNSPLQPFLVSLLGLVPNCAISVMLTLLFVKHTISFGALISGLCTSGGLGILVLLTKNKDKKDTAIIISTLVLISSIVGLIFQYNVFNINHIFSFIEIQL